MNLPPDIEAQARRMAQSSLWHIADTRRLALMGLSDSEADLLLTLWSAMGVTTMAGADACAQSMGFVSAQQYVQAMVTTLRPGAELSACEKAEALARFATSMPPAGPDFEPVDGNREAQHNRLHRLRLTQERQSDT